MEKKDLVYISLVTVLGFFLYKKISSVDSKQKQLPKGGVLASDNIANGGLNLGQNMDLTNLTPTPKDGLQTEEALNNSNITPLTKEDNEPTQVFGNYNLPAPYATSIINPNPIDTAVTNTLVSTKPEPIQAIDYSSNWGGLSFPTSPATSIIDTNPIEKILAQTLTDYRNGLIQPPATSIISPNPIDSIVIKPSIPTNSVMTSPAKPYLIDTIDYYYENNGVNKPQASSIAISEGKTPRYTGNEDD